MKLHQYYDPLEEIIEKELDNFRKLKRFLTVNETAEFFCVSPKTIRKWIRHGKLSAVKIDREYRIPRISILQFAQKRSNLKI